MIRFILDALYWGVTGRMHGGRDRAPLCEVRERPIIRGPAPARSDAVTRLRRIICAVFHRRSHVYLLRTPEPTCIACLLAGAP